MPSSFETVMDDLETYLKAELPTSWKIQNADLPIGNTTGLVLTYGLDSFSNTVVGQQLPYTHLAADFLLELSAPQKDANKALKALLPALPLVTRALDDANGITWETVTRGITAAGETIFSVKITILVSTFEEE